ncbi:MAG: DUF3050 domain-containing protein [Rhodocyclaceae bacterium]|nr:DUF3050 domain-containing protein [Rhodocyclaceae bacterium]
MKLDDLPGIAELKQRLEAHPLYAEVRSLADLRCFMAHHVFSVWDFMSLLKYLQNAIAPTAVPWLPTGEREATRLQRYINEIVLGEECDEGLPDEQGQPVYVSHFDLYLGAMEEVGADTKPVRTFLATLRAHGLAAALERPEVPAPARRFMAQTFRFLDSHEPHRVAAAFSLGREQIIPGMFRAILAEFGIDKAQAPLFHYYIERHIHLDDEVHGPLSLALMQHLCGENETKRIEAIEAGRLAIEARIEFWHGVRAALPSRHLHEGMR